MSRMENRAARLRRADENGSADEARLSLLATGLAAIEPLFGPDVHYGQAYQAEFYRLKGELLERDGLTAADEVVECFQQSLRLGREMGTSSWELRAAMNLVRLRMRQGEAYAAESTFLAKFCYYD